MYSFLSIFVLAVILLFTGLTGQRKHLHWMLVLGLTGIFGLNLWEWAQYDPTVEGPAVLAGMMSFDYFALGFSAVAILVTLLIALLSGFAFRNLDNSLGDHYGLILFSLCGAICLFSFENILMLFLGVEIMSIPLYVLAGSQRDKLASNEAALKYYLMGAFVAGVLLFGLALVFGATNSLDLQGIRAYLAGAMDRPGIFYVGVTLIFIAMSFKVAAAPFHFWSPDVYEGSPTLVTAFMATVVKIGGFAAFFHLTQAFHYTRGHWDILLAGIAALTMVVGNVTAVYQQRFKRMLAYSSISHTGYLFLGLLVGTPESVGSIFLYITSYALATIGAFSVFILVNEQTGKDNFEAFNGLGKRKPLLAIAMTVCVLSLAGIPPTAGFFGKYFLFSGALPHWPWLVLVALVNSAISIYYYFKVIMAMFFTAPADDAAEISVPWTYTLVAAITVALVAALCVVPGYVMGLV